MQVVAILQSGAKLPFEVTSIKVDLPELQGEPEDITKEKCRIASRVVGGPVMCEDTSLCFNALKGLPGEMNDFGDAVPWDRSNIAC